MDDDKFLVKLKMGGCSDEVIAKRMGIAREEVARRWDALSAVFNGLASRTAVETVERFRRLCSDYEAMGEGLKTLSFLLSSQAGYTDLKKARPDLTEDQILFLMNNFILFKPFQFPASVPASALPLASSSN